MPQPVLDLSLGSTGAVLVFGAFVLFYTMVVCAFGVVIAEQQRLERALKRALAELPRLPPVKTTGWDSDDESDSDSDTAVGDVVDDSQDTTSDLDEDGSGWDSDDESDSDSDTDDEDDDDDVDHSQGGVMVWYSATSVESSRRWPLSVAAGDLVL
ncbi:hypothetical protein QBC35DRAFT_455269 [Podospora australis]|uniref:Transmembrane protein n=1 Tax=Podospora australis TaxID=1536484 RepID=A0AAN7AG03_9PEZI|nr:hypothetical protein QBC35DRAFT_455269 [Podospora australis]